MKTLVSHQYNIRAINTYDVTMLSGKCQDTIYTSIIFRSAKKPKKQREYQSK